MLVLVDVCRIDRQAAITMVVEMPKPCLSVKGRSIGSSHVVLGDRFFIGISVLVLGKKAEGHVSIHS